MNQRGRTKAYYKLFVWQWYLSGVLDLQHHVQNGRREAKAKRIEVRTSLLICSMNKVLFCKVGPLGSMCNFNKQ